MARAAHGLTIGADEFETATILREGADGLTRIVTGTLWQERKSALIEAYEAATRGISPASPRLRSFMGVLRLLGARSRSGSGLGLFAHVRFLAC